MEKKPKQIRKEFEDEATAAKYYDKILFEKDYENLFKKNFNFITRILLKNDDNEKIPNSGKSIWKIQIINLVPGTGIQQTSVAPEWIQIYLFA